MVLYLIAATFMYVMNIPNLEPIWSFPSCCLSFGSVLVIPLLDMSAGFSFYLRKNFSGQLVSPC